MALESKCVYSLLSVFVLVLLTFYTFIHPSAVTKHFSSHSLKFTRWNESSSDSNVNSVRTEQDILHRLLTQTWVCRWRTGCVVVLLLCCCVSLLTPSDWKCLYSLSSQRSPLCVEVNTVKLSQIQQSANSSQAQISSCGCFLKDKQVFIFQQSDYPGAEARPGSVSVL